MKTNNTKIRILKDDKVKFNFNGIDYYLLKVLNSNIEFELKTNDYYVCRFFYDEDDDEFYVTHPYYLKHEKDLNALYDVFKWLRMEGDE